jgi:1-acyl-sn-glycerol-3-phosphate acyltransferase
VVDHMNHVDQLALMIAPEGRLRRVSHWRSGFYYIAMGAGVPIVPGYMDYSKKEIRLGEAFIPSGDIEADMADIQAFFAPAVARFPEKASPVQVRPRTEAMTNRLNERAARNATDTPSEDTDVKSKTARR